MSVDPALTVNELAALAGPSVVRSYLVYDTDTDDNVVATAQVDATIALTYPLTRLIVRNTSAGWSDITYNDTVLIGTSAGACDRGIYRVRKPGTSDTLELMAIGSNDSGELAIATRNVAISDFDYITVLKRFDMFGVFPRIVYITGTDGDIFEDWGKTVGNFNRYPPPIVNVTIAGKSGNYGVHVYNSTSATFDITIDLTLWPTSSTGAWAFVLPTGVTLNSGSLSGSGTTATINVTVPHSADSYTFGFLGVEDHGSSFKAYRKVWVKSFTYPPLEIVRIDSDTWDTTGAQLSLTLNSLEGLPPCAMVHYFEMDTWNGVDVPTACTSMTGYVIRQKENTDIGVANVSLDIAGPSYVLDQIGGQSQIFSAINATPSTWQQLYYGLSYLDFVIWGFIAQRVAGLLQMFNYTPFGLTNTEKRMTDWRMDTGTLLSQVQELAFRYGKGNFGCDPTGEVFLRRPPSLVSNGDRSSIPTRITFNETIYKSVEMGHEIRPRVRRLRGEAFYSDGLTTNTPVWCDAPPVPGQGQSEEKLEKQIVDNADELYELTGNDYQWRNNPYPSCSMVVPKNYAVFKPAQMLRQYLNIPAYLRYDRIAFAGYITIDKVTRVHNADGTVDTQLGFATETVGLLATNVPIPSPDPSLYNSPYQAIPFAPLPFFQSPNPNPAGTSEGAQVIPRNGSVGFLGTETQAFVVSNMLGTPLYRDVTPSDLGTYKIQHGARALTGGRAYLLAWDEGTNKSAIWTTENLYATSVIWNKGDDFDKKYKTVALSSATPGSLLAYSPNDGASETVYDFTVSNQGFIVDPDPSAAGTYAAGDGWQAADPAGGTFDRILAIDKFFTARSVTTVEVTFADVVIGTDPAPGSRNGFIQLWNSGILVATSPNVPIMTGETFRFLGTTAVTADQVRIVYQISSGAPLNTGTLTCTKVVINSGGAFVRASTDYGATVGSAVSVGDSPGPVGGFDLQHGGTVSYAASANAIKKATTLGGSYSTDQTLTGVNAGLIEIPWYTRNSLSTLNSGGSPEYIYGLTAPDGSNHSLFWVVSGSPVNITPTISSNPGLVTNSNCLTTWKGKYIAAVLSFAGVLHLVTSIDAGTTWIDRGAVDAPYIRVRRQAATPGQIFAAGSVLKYSPTFGKTLISKTKPSSDDLVFYEAVG